MIVCLSVCGFTLYQQYFSYLTATVHKSMFPWTIFNQYLTSTLFRHWRASRSAIPTILSAKGGKPLLPDVGLSRPGIERSRFRGGRADH